MFRGGSYMFKNVIFDLDGTLVNSIGDLADSINKAILKMGYHASFSEEETMALVGSGTDVMIARALNKCGLDQQMKSEVKSHYLEIYQHNNTNFSYAYRGLSDLIKELKKGGIRIFCCTNKPDDIAQNVVNFFYPNLFDAIVGQKAGMPVKPDPYAVNLLINKYALDKMETLFVGDSDVDVKTGANAGLDVCWVGWGFRKYSQIQALEPKYIAASISELKQIILK